MANWAWVRRSTSKSSRKEVAVRVSTIHSPDFAYTV